MKNAIKNVPVKTLRNRRIKAAIWENHGAKGVFYTVTISRSFKQNDSWRDKRGDRFKFLPRAFFVPDLVVDFQQLKSCDIKSIKEFRALATLDSPFAESVAARFARYFNRLGTPDLDKSVVFNRLQVASKP